MPNPENVIGKGNRFSKDNQPDPKLKRVPKYKTRFKKFIINNIDVVEKEMKNGNHKFWLLAFERAYGKETQPIDFKNVDNLTEKEIDDLIQSKLKLINDSIPTK